MADPSASGASRAAERRSPTCQKHGEVMYPITFQGDPVSVETGIWQCRSCQVEFCAALDAQSSDPSHNAPEESS